MIIIFDILYKKQIRAAQFIRKFVDVKYEKLMIFQEKK